MNLADNHSPGKNTGAQTVDEVRLCHCEPVTDVTGVAYSLKVASNQTFYRRTDSHASVATLARNDGSGGLSTH